MAEYLLMVPTPPKDGDRDLRAIIISANYHQLLAVDAVQLLGNPDFLPVFLCDKLVELGVLIKENLGKLKDGSVLHQYTWPDPKPDFGALSVEALHELAWDLRFHPRFAHLIEVPDISECYDVPPLPVDVLLELHDDSAPAESVASSALEAARAAVASHVVDPLRAIGADGPWSPPVLTVAEARALLDEGSEVGKAVRKRLDRMERAIGEAKPGGTDPGTRTRALPVVPAQPAECWTCEHEAGSYCYHPAHTLPAAYREIVGRMPPDWCPIRAKLAKAGGA